MSFPRRKFLQFAGAAAIAPAFLRVASAQTYPSRPITMVVPFPPGGGLDVGARILAEPMRKCLGQPVIIENVSGAEGSLGVGRVARANADGYTISVGNIDTHVLNGAFYSLSYDVLNDFVPIAVQGAAPYVMLARRTMPARNLPELIAWLKANPNKASAGIQNSGVRMLMALFRQQTGTQFALVPYRGGGPAMQDLLAGQIDLLMAVPAIGLPLLGAGSIKAYAVTGEVRLASASDIPTFVEMGLPGLSFSEWGGLFAPKGTPKDIIGKLNSASVEALADPAVRSRIAAAEVEIFPREKQTPEALAALQKSDAERWWPIIKELGIRAE
jgi:tripartite-type tricarboxylate transporter receptor subunit TctC